jgi:hypothetical protein
MLKVCYALRSFIFNNEGTVPDPLTVPYRLPYGKRLTCMDQVHLYRSHPSAHWPYSIDSIIAELQENFKMTDEGDIQDYLGIHITKLDAGWIKLTQPHLIDQIINDVEF